MTPEMMRKIIGITPDINEDYVDENQLTDELMEFYSLIQNNKLSTKSTKLSKSYYLSEQYNKLLLKKRNGPLTEQETRLLAYLQETTNGN